MKQLVYIFAMVACTFMSCINDESQYGDLELTTDEVKIKGSELTESPVKNIALGKECVIRPVINMDPEELKYQWSIGTYNKLTGKGEMSLASEESVFTHTFLKMGSYYVHLSATDGKTGDVMEWIVNVNEPYQKGILIISNSEDGKDNLAFMKELTPEELEEGLIYSVEEHTLNRINPDVNFGKLVGATRTVMSWKSDDAIMLVAGEEKGYFVRPTTFELVATSEYSSVYSGFKATEFIGTDYSNGYPFVYDVNQKRAIHFDKVNWFVYETAIKFFENAHYEAVYPTYWAADYSSWGMGYVLSPDPIYVNYSTSEVVVMEGNTASAVSSGNLFNGKEILFVMRDKESYGAKYYVIAADKNSPNDLYQFTTSVLWGGTYPNWELSLQVEKEVKYTVLDSKNIPVRGTKPAISSTNMIAYYGIGDRLYSYTIFNPIPEIPENPIISYDGEEITCVTMNDAATPEELYVATYNSTAKRGSLYIYSFKDLRDGNYTPIHEFKNCADKIIDVKYKN